MTHLEGRFFTSFQPPTCCKCQHPFGEKQHRPCNLKCGHFLCSPCLYDLIHASTPASALSRPKVGVQVNVHCPVDNKSTEIKRTSLNYQNFLKVKSDKDSLTKASLRDDYGSLNKTNEPSQLSLSDLLDKRREEYSICNDRILNHLHSFSSTLFFGHDLIDLIEQELESNSVQICHGEELIRKDERAYKFGYWKNAINDYLHLKEKEKIAYEKLHAKIKSNIEFISQSLASLKPNEMQEFEFELRQMQLSADEEERINKTMVSEEFLKKFANEIDFLSKKMVGKDGDDQQELIDILKKLKDRKDGSINMTIKSNGVKFIIGVVGNGGRSLWKPSNKELYFKTTFCKSQVIL
jgi:hypothetical protein